MNQQQKALEEIEAKLAFEINEHRKTKIKLKMREHENHAITQSRSYKLARLFASSLLLVRNGMGWIKGLSPNRVIFIAKNKHHVRKAYRSDNFLRCFNEPAQSTVAVILHVFYPEMLPFFKQQLKALEGVKYDLYVTLPEAEADSTATVHQQLPKARIALVPNGGRDVLPFVEVVKQIEKNQYTKVLKLHTKKSPHRPDGDMWRQNIVKNLLPKDGRIIQDILRVLDQQDTALIGPAGEYVSILVNMSATERYARAIITRLCGKKKYLIFMRQCDEYGFFGGTMFWARMNVVLPIAKAVSCGDFEPEMGQEDSTLAHGLERLFNVIPELEGKKLYESSDTGLIPRDYETTNIPKWAEMSIDD